MICFVFQMLSLRINCLQVEQHMKSDTHDPKKDEVVLVLTAKQADFLWKLLDGFIARESGNAIGTPAIIRRASQIGKRLSRVCGWRWRWNAR